MTEIIKVIIREKPSVGQDEVVIRHCDLIKNRIFVEDRPFAVGQFFNSKANQEDVYASIQPLVKKFLDGYSCNIMAYGQSGTGKSFTMGLQSENFENSNCGIVHRALQEIMIAQGTESETTIEISFLEIYNEKVFDLLSDKTDEPINNKGFKLFTGGVRRPLKTMMDAELILMEGNKNRRTRPTAMNTNSSRSHGIVVVYKKTRNLSSSFYMVDLAGSEGVRRTGHKGEALAEGSHINRGLLGIGNIFKALSDGNCWIPYRDTVLGSVLQDSLSVNGFSTLVICISALKKDVSETINSLTFAQKVKNLKNIPKLQPLLLADGKKKQTPRKDEWNSSVDQENLETPISIRRPTAASTAVTSRSKYRPNLHRILETPTPISLKNCTIGRSLTDLENSQIMESPTVKQCFEAMKRTLQKRNIRIKSINFSPVDQSSISTSDCSFLSSTVIQNVQCEPNETTAQAANEISFQVTKGIQVPVTNEVQLPELNEISIQVTKDIPVEVTSVMPDRTTNEIPVRAADSSIYMTKEECIRLVESQLANFTRVVADVIVNKEISRHAEFINTNHNIDSDVDLELSNTIKDDVNELVNELSNTSKDGVLVNELSNISKDDVLVNDTISFEFKVPENPVPVIKSNQRRRSVRIKEIQEKRKSIIPPSPNKPPPKRRQTTSENVQREKRRRTTISKKDRETIIEQSVSKSEHCKNVLNLLNNGDMKAIQVLPQIGVKTAYCIITHRSLNGKFKNFKEVAKAPFWRGRAWERFEKANNLC